MRTVHAPRLFCSPDQAIPCEHKGRCLAPHALMENIDSVLAAKQCEILFLRIDNELEHRASDLFRVTLSKTVE
ncbi:hypothetical protein B0G76_5902 [Paraburkholderia sp. BL23I1N1]|nr:hypothetical protein B0G76_5902 [Paraburkholderia sp. BL23I1N1]